MPTGSRPRPWLVAAAGLGCVAVVAGVGRWLGTSSLRNDAATSAATSGAEDVVRFLFVATLLAGLVLIVVNLFTGGWQRPESERPVRRVSILGSILIGTLIVLLLWLVRRRAGTAPAGHPVTHGPGAPISFPATTTVPGTRHHPTSPAASAVAHWPVLLGVLLLLVVGGLALAQVLRSRRTVGRATEGPAAGGGPGEPLDLQPFPASFDPDAEPDDRLAVIAVYHWVQDTLARHGRARREAEAPFDHLRRVLGGPDDPLPPAWRVTSAFELARYSDHEVSSALRTEAVAASRAVVDHFEASS
jgi:hypothetical protein